MNIKRSNSYLIITFTVLAFGLRLYRLDAQSLWWDELYTVASMALPLPEMVDNLFDDRVHLPLYFLLMQAWGEIGRGELIVRYFSVLCGVLTIPLIYQTGRLLGGVSVGVLAALLLAVSPFHIWYSQEARMYSFLALNALAANFFLLRLFRYERLGDWVGYTFTLIFTLYSHYLGALLLLAHYVFFSLHYRHNKQLFKHWLVSTFMAGAAFMAWFLAVYLVSSFTQASISWIAPADWYEPLLTLLAFAAGRTIDPQRPFYYLPLLAFVLASLVSLHYAQRTATLTYHHLAARLLWLWLIVPLGLITLISFDWGIPSQRFVYMDRYIISLLPAFVLLAGWGAVIAARRRRGLLLIFGAMILGPTAVSLYNLYFNPAYARENWRGAVAHIAANQQSNDVLLLNPEYILPLAYYEEASVARKLLTETTEVEQALTIASQTYQRVWLIRSFNNAETHGFTQRRNEEVATAPPDKYEAWLTAHLTPLGQWTFTGIRLALYDVGNFSESFADE